MKKTEAAIQAEVQLYMSSIGAPVFRNNNGAYKTESGRFIRYGVGGTGGSDLIGITPITITPEMVGRTIGVFTALEVKTKTGRPTEAQTLFIKAIRRAGGIAGIVRSSEDAKKLTGEYKHDNS